MDKVEFGWFVMYCSAHHNIPTDPSEVNDSAFMETAAITAAYLQSAAKVQQFSENRNKYGTYLYHGHSISFSKVMSL